MKICEHCGCIIPLDMVHISMNATTCATVARNVAEAAPRCGNCGAIEIPGYLHELLVEGACHIRRMTAAELESQQQQRRSDRAEPSTAL